MRSDVLRKLLELKNDLTRQGYITSFSDGKKSVLEINADKALIQITLFSEPLPTSYFNIQLVAHIDEADYTYIGSEREYTGIEEEMQTIRNITRCILEDKYKIVKRKLFWKWVNTYLDIKITPNDTVSLLKTKG